MSWGRDRRCSPSGTAVDARPVAGEVGDEIEGVLPRHVGVLQAMDDVHGAAGVEGRGADEVPPAVLDQGAGDRVGAVAVARGAQEHARLLDVPARGGRQVRHISSVMSQAGRDQHQRLDAVCGFGSRQSGVGRRVPAAIDCRPPTARLPVLRSSFRNNNKAI